MLRLVRDGFSNRGLPMQVQMPKATFDPRSSRVANPFVQAYLEKQSAKAKPIGDRQKVVNLILTTVLALNLAVLGVFAWSARSSIVPQLTGATEQDATMGEAMARIKSLEVTLQNMRNSVEFHKNAYYKLEQEHETLKAAVARVVPAENFKETFANYGGTLPVTSDSATQASENAQSEKAVHAARD